MKKLIALLSSVAIVASFSFSAMAATSTTVYTAGTDTFVTTVTADVGDQATLLAFPGATLDTTGGTNIQFIDQQTTTAGATVFTYKMKTTPTAGQAYTIKVGGSLLATPLSETITPIAAASGYTVSGTVSNAADTLEDVDLDAIWSTKVALRTVAYGDMVAGFTPVTVDMTAKTFSIPLVPVGTYVLQIERLGYLTRCMLVTVTDANVDVGDTELLGGDFIPAGEVETDGACESGDFSTFLPAFGKSLGDDGYIYDVDLYPDGTCESGDFAIFVAAFGKDITIYEGADVALNYAP